MGSIGADIVQGGMIMFEGIGNQTHIQQQQQMQQQMGQEQYYDPYALPIDPYIQQRPSNNWNAQMLSKLFDTSLTAREIAEGEYSQMLRAIFMDLRRIPSIATSDRRRLVRDFADLEGLMHCDGTKGRVRSRRRKMVYEINILTGDGGAPIVGLTGVSAMITQKSQMEQQVKIPQEPERKRIMGIF